MPATAAGPPRVERSRSVPALFGAAIFLAAALLFMVQPMVGRMALPLLGGSPEVWNTAMVFFQLLLLAGYAYAHLVQRWLGRTAQTVFHGIVVCLPLLALPIALPEWTPPAEGWPSWWLMALLFATLGAPFFALSATTPLLQRWLSWTTHETGRDPYFLYVASNAGSLIGLLAYPLLLEPLLGLGVQARVWAWGYLGFILLTGSAGLVALRLRGAPAAGGGERVEESLVPGTTPSGSHGIPSEDAAPPTARDRLFWTACALVPSALLLAVTHWLTSEVASVPLLWVAPLAVYLGTFMVAFAQRPLVPLPLASRLMAVAAVVFAVTLLGRLRDPAAVMILLHLAVLAAGGLLCHGRLAERRPPPRHLTEFYLLVAVGGVLGGASTALLAPRVFDSIAEYPIAVALACLLRLPQQTGDGGRNQRVLDVALPAGLFLVMLALELGWDRIEELLPTGPVVVVAVVLPAIACYALSPRPLRFALGAAVLLGFGQLAPTRHLGDIVHGERTFFGVHRIARDPEGRFHTLFHGPTLHGAQSTDPARPLESLSYYHASGPAGQVMRALARNPGEQRVAVVGLGTGALAALASPGDRLTFYEIDPAVVRIAEDSRYFTYLERTPASYETVLGDARLSLARGDDVYDLIVLDAFSSANVPIHLLTREALRLYLSRLAPEGVLLFHVSNRHADLAAVLGALAADLDLAGALRIDLREEEDQERGILSSEWTLLGRSPEALAPYVDRRWFPLQAPPDAPVWTDDYANVLAVYRWN